MDEIRNTKNGGITTRVGLKFHSEIKELIRKKLSNNTIDDKVSIKKITNMIVAHNLWNSIKKDIEEAEFQEVNTYGL